MLNSARPSSSTCLVETMARTIGSTNLSLRGVVTNRSRDLTALFYGRPVIPGVICGARVRFRGRAGDPARLSGHDQLAYELL